MRLDEKIRQRLIERGVRGQISRRIDRGGIGMETEKFDTAAEISLGDQAFAGGARRAAVIAPMIGRRPHHRKLNHLESRSWRNS